MFLSSARKARELPTWDGNGTVQDFTEPCFFREKKQQDLYTGLLCTLDRRQYQAVALRRKHNAKLFANNCLHALDIVRQLCGNRMLQCFSKPTPNYFLRMETPESSGEQSTRNLAWCLSLGVLIQTRKDMFVNGSQSMSNHFAAATAMLIRGACACAHNDRSSRK